MGVDTTEMRRKIKDFFTVEIERMEHEISTLKEKRKILSDRVAKIIATEQGFAVGEHVKIKRINGKTYHAVIDSITSAWECLYNDEFTVNVLPVSIKEDGSIVKAMATVPFSKEQCRIVDGEKIFVEGD